MRIHISKNSQQFGPYDEEQLTEQIAQGIISYDDLAWAEGMTDWQPLRTICAPAQGTPPPPPPPPTPSATTFSSGTGTPTDLPNFEPSFKTDGKNNGYVISILSILFSILVTLYVGAAGISGWLLCWMFFASLVSASVYLLPARIAAIRRLPNFWFIFLLNLVTGATGIAWLVCLFWVCLAKSPAKSVSISGAP